MARDGGSSTDIFWHLSQIIDAMASSMGDRFYVDPYNTCTYRTRPFTSCGWFYKGHISSIRAGSMERIWTRGREKEKGKKGMDLIYRFTPCFFALKPIQYVWRQIIMGPIYRFRGSTSIHWWHFDPSWQLSVLLLSLRWPYRQIPLFLIRSRIIFLLGLGELC